MLFLDRLNTVYDAFAVTSCDVFQVVLAYARFGSFSGTKDVEWWFQGYPQVSTEYVFTISDNMSYNKF